MEGFQNKELKLLNNSGPYLEHTYTYRYIVLKEKNHIGSSNVHIVNAFEFLLHLKINK